MMEQAAEFDWTFLDPDNVNEDPLEDKDEEALRVQVMEHANKENNGRIKVLEMQQNYGLRWLSFHSIACLDVSE